MFKYSLFLLLSFSALAQDCLKGSITIGTVTVSCTAMDNTNSLAAAEPGLFAGLFASYPPSYLLWVKVTSTDRDVIGVRITVTYPGGVPGSSPSKAAGVILKTPTSIPDPVALAYVFTLAGAPWPVKISSVVVEELKAASTQTVLGN